MIHRFRMVSLASLGTLLIAAMAAWAPEAAAARRHLHLVGSTPSAGDTVREPVRQLRLRFSERPETRLTAIAVHAPGPVQIGVAAGAVDSADEASLLFALQEPLPAGPVEVQWRTVSSDGHPVTGTFTFVVDSAAALAQPAPVPGAGVTAPAETTAHSLVSIEPSPLAPDSRAGRGARWIEFVALLTMIGAVGVALFVVPNSSWSYQLARDATERARSIGQGGLLLLVMAGVARLYGEAALFPDTTMTSLLLDTSWGRGWLVGIIGALLAGIGIWRAKAGSGGWWLALLGAIVAASSPAFTGHAMAAPTARTLSVIVDVLHVLAVGLWIGGLFVIAAGIIPVALRRETSDRGSRVGSLVRAFHPLGLVGAGLALLTGLVASWMRLGGRLDQLLGSDYGRALLVKLGLFLVVAAIGAYHARRVVPARWNVATVSRFRGTLMAEVLLALLILAVTAVLVSLPLPAPDFEGAPVSQVGSGAP